MFFFNKKIQKKEEHNIELIVARLEHSEYLEDKIEAINELNILSDTYVLEVGTYGLYQIIEFLNETEQPECVLCTLQKILNSEYASEFCDFIAKSTKSVQTLIANFKKSPFIFCNFFEILTKSKFFCTKFVTCDNSASFTVMLLDFNCTNILHRILGIDENFDKQIIFEGIFEKLILNDCDKNIELITHLLKNNHFNQNYFIETNWHTLSNHHMLNNIVNVLIDNTNINIEYIKDKVYKIVGFDNINDNCEYIYKMIHGSKKYCNILQDLISYETIENVLNSNFKIGKGSETQVSDQDIVFILLYYLINRHTIIYSSSNYEYLVTSELLKYCKNIYIDQCRLLLSQNKVEDMDAIRKYCKNSALSFSLLLLFATRELYTEMLIYSTDLNTDSIIYYLVMGDRDFMLKHRLVLVNNCDKSSLYNNLCILLCCIYDIKTKYNTFYKVLALKEARRQILDEKFLVEEMRILILDKINETILALL